MGAAMPRADGFERGRTSPAPAMAWSCHHLPLSLGSRRSVATEDLHGTPESRVSRSLGPQSEVLTAGIVIWDTVNVSGGPDALLADLAAREREGADVIIAIVAQPEPEDFEPKSWTRAHHGVHALVYADLRQSDRYHRNLLRTLAQLLGATPTTDSAAKQLGSFMSDAEVAAGAAPTIDPDNRRVVITNKGRPFAHAGEEI